MVDWRKYFPVIMIICIGIVTVIFIAWLLSLPLPVPPGYP